MLALFSACLILGQPKNPPEPVAMVLTIKGTVTLRRGSADPVRVRAITLLHAADKISVAVDGEIVYVLLADGQRERLTAKAQVILGPKGAAPAEAVQRLMRPALPPANLESLRELARSSKGAIGVPRGEAPPRPQVVTPLFGATILIDRPTLTWPDAKAEAYLVQLFRGGQGNELWNAVI